jgi:hypothetical protein
VGVTKWATVCELRARAIALALAEAVLLVLEEEHRGGRAAAALGGKVRGGITEDEWEASAGRCAA